MWNRKFYTFLHFWWVDKSTWFTQSWPGSSYSLLSPSLAPSIVSSPSLCQPSGGLVRFYSGQVRLDRSHLSICEDIKCLGELWWLVFHIYVHIQVQNIDEQLRRLLERWEAQRDVKGSSVGKVFNFSVQIFSSSFPCLFHCQQGYLVQPLHLYWSSFYTAFTWSPWSSSSALIKTMQRISPTGSSTPWCSPTAAPWCATMWATKTRSPFYKVYSKPWMPADRNPWQVRGVCGRPGWDKAVQGRSLARQATRDLVNLSWPAERVAQPVDYLFLGVYVLIGNVPYDSQCIAMM